MHMVTVTKQGQITLPKEYRDVLKLDKNPKLIATLHNKYIVLEAQDPQKSLRGILKGKLTYEFDLKTLDKEINDSFAEAVIEKVERKRKNAILA